MATPAENNQPNLRHDYAQVNGVRLHYAESGSGKNLVILIHGFPEFWYSWRHQLAALANDFHAVAPDMRGYNLSDKPTRVEDYRIEVLVEDVVGLIDHFGAEKAAIVGHDWGASVAWALAQKYPSRVSKLVALQVPPAAVWRTNMTLRQGFSSWYMFFFQLPGIPEWAISRKDFEGIHRAFNQSTGRQGSFNETDIERYKEALRQPGTMTAAINYYRANVRRLISRMNKRSAPRGEKEGRIKVPTLFIYGERDIAILPSTVRNVEKYIDAPYREVRIADSGHWVQNEAAEEVNKALLEFLKSD